MMGVDIQIYRCRIGMYNCGLGPKLSDKSMVFRDVASGISTFSAVCFIGVLLVMAGIEPNPGPTGTHNSGNPLCKNWNRVAYGYRYVKTGLTRLISSQVAKRHTILKLEVDHQCHDVSPCSGCTFHTLLPDHGTLGCNQEEGSSCPCLEDPCTRTKCPNNFCGRFYHLIVDDHARNSPRWSSADPTKWYNDFFQYAKCFLSTDSSANSVSDLDCTDLLTIVIHNKYIHNSVDEVKSFQQCLEDRNKIFHSGSFEVTDSELDNYIDNMISVLEDKTCLINNLDAQQAVKELNKLKNDLIEISDEDIDGLLNKIESENTFIFRCQYLLIEIGTKVLRHIFDDRVGPNFGHYLVSTKDNNNKLEGDKLQDLIKQKRIITAAQAKFLPPIDINSSSANFDITLLTCLLRNVCGMRPSGDPEWMNPSGYSTEADITRLKNCRNDLAHSDTVMKSTTDFNVKWDESCRILNRLNHGLKANKITNLQSLIYDSQHLCIDEKKQRELNTIMEAWKKMDGDVIAVVEQCTDKIEQEMKRGFDSVQQVAEQRTDRIEQEMKRGFDSVQQVAEHRTDRIEQEMKRGFDSVQQVAEQRTDRIEQEMKRGFDTVQQVVELHTDRIEQGIKRGFDTVQLTLKEVKKPQMENEKDVQKDLIKHYHHYFRTLPVSPLFENKDEHLLNIYKPLTVNSIEQTKDSKQIIGYESLFFKEGVSLKQVCMTGDAGVGKSSFCKCMCLLWSMAKSGDKLEKKHEGLQKDMKYMSKFDFVFYINLRDTSQTHVVHMIIEQLFNVSREKYALAIQSILRDKPCLIILDSLDEWDPKSSDKKEYKLPERIHSDACVCLTTCRPHRMESVRLSRKRDYDQLVQITGLHGDSLQSYIEDVISYMNIENSSSRNAEDFINEIRKCGLLEQLNIPIIVSHLVILWFEKTLTVMPRALIYANILEMVFKRAEQRKVECPSISPPAQQLPDSLSGMEHLNKYVCLLYNVCHLSFRSLFKQDENVSSLVFTKQQLQAKPYCFSIEETDFLCKIGILSKNEVSGCYTEERLKVSFIHKSYIEFFTALYITSFDSINAFTDITKKWKSLNDVLQYENLFLLLAGFSYDRVKILFEDIHLTISDDLSLCRKNAIFHYDMDTYREQIKSLQTIVNKCYMEVSNTYNSNMLLKLEDFIFDSPSGNDDITSLKELLALNKTSVKSIHSVNGEYFDIFDQIKNLQCLNVGKVLQDDYKKFTQCMLENKSTLHTVCIDGASDTKPWIPQLPVRSLQHLTSLSLSRVEMHLDSLHNLVKFFSDNVLMENIKLFRVYFNYRRFGYLGYTFTLNLPHHTKLTSLCLAYVDILCNNVNKSSSKYIALYSFSERIASRYINVVNCVKDSQLECLGISVRNRLDHNAVRTLIHAVITLQCMKVLSLWSMKLPDDVLLQLHPHVTQVEIELGDVTMSRQSFHSFIEKFVNNKTVVEVRLYEFKITPVDGETHRELSVQESLDDMSKYLTSIPTVNITYKIDIKVKISMV